MPKPFSSTLRKVAHWTLLIFAFLLPLVALPWTSEVLEINKQVLLFGATGVVVLSWLVGSLIDRQVEVRFNYLLVPLAVYVAAVGLSTIFSQAGFLSWTGASGSEDTSFLTVVCAALLAVVIPLLHRGFEEGRRLGWMLVGSALLMSFISLLPLLKIKLGIFGNTIGSPMALSIFLLAALAWASSWWLVCESKKENDSRLLASRIGVGVLSVLSAIVLLFLDSPLIWVLGICVSVVLLGLGFFYAEHFPSPTRFIPAVFLFTLSFTFLLFQDPFTGVSFRPEVAPSQATTFATVRGVWGDGGAFIGTGPGTFGLGYAHHVPESVNNTAFWDVVFNRGAGQFLTMMATHGIVGTLAFITFVLAIAVAAFRRLLKARSRVALAAIAPPLTAWLVLVIAFVLYPTNMTLTVWFWLLSGILLAELLPPATVWSLGQSHRARFATYAAALLAIVGSVVVGYLVSTKYLANVAYARALTLARDEGDRDRVVALLNRATSSWKNDAYLRDFAARLLVEGGQEAAKETPNEERFGSLLGGAVEAANRAVEASPTDPRNWDVRGLVFRELIPLTPDAGPMAIESYEKAISLWPANPRLHTELARVYIILADAQVTLIDSDDEAVSAKAEADREAHLAKAEEQLKASSDLNTEYILARYYYAFVQERQGKVAEAVTNMEAVRTAQPNDLGVGMQLAFLYLRQGKNDLAKTELDRVLELAPNFSNAHWYLSVIYEQEGKIPEAIAETEKVLELNPDNTAVTQRLERLRTGGTTPPPADGTLPEPLDGGTVEEDPATPPV